MALEIKLEIEGYVLSINHCSSSRAGRCVRLNSKGFTFCPFQRCRPGPFAAEIASRTAQVTARVAMLWQYPVPVDGSDHVASSRARFASSAESFPPQKMGGAFDKKCKPNMGDPTSTSYGPNMLYLGVILGP